MTLNIAEEMVGQRGQYFCILDLPRPYDCVTKLCNILSDMHETPLVRGLCETFVSHRDNFSVWDFQFSGYVSERKERQVMEPGGLALLIKEAVSLVREDLLLWLEGRLQTLSLK